MDNQLKEKIEQLYSKFSCELQDFCHKELDKIMDENPDIHGHVEFDRVTACLGASIVSVIYATIESNGDTKEVTEMNFSDQIDTLAKTIKMRKEALEDEDTRSFLTSPVSIPKNSLN